MIKDHAVDWAVRWHDLFDGSWAAVVFHSQIEDPTRDYPILFRVCLLRWGRSQVLLPRFLVDLLPLFYRTFPRGCRRRSAVSFNSFAPDASDPIPSAVPPLLLEYEHRLAGAERMSMDEWSPNSLLIQIKWGPSFIDGDIPWRLKGKDGSLRLIRSDQSTNVLISFRTAIKEPPVPFRR